MEQNKFDAIIKTIKEGFGLENEKLSDYISLQVAPIFERDTGIVMTEAMYEKIYEYMADKDAKYHATKKLLEIYMPTVRAIEAREKLLKLKYADSLDENKFENAKTFWEMLNIYATFDSRDGYKINDELNRLKQSIYYIDRLKIAVDILDTVCDDGTLAKKIILLRYMDKDFYEKNQEIYFKTRENDNLYNAGNRIKYSIVNDQSVIDELNVSRNRYFSAKKEAIKTLGNILFNNDYETIDLILSILDTASNIKAQVISAM